VNYYLQHPLGPWARQVDGAPSQDAKDVEGGGMNPLHIPLRVRLEEHHKLPSGVWVEPRTKTVLVHFQLKRMQQILWSMVA